MAKTKMVCPFSSNLCRECALYRGRHYYLCFCDEYRGHLDDPGYAGDIIPPPASGLSTIRKFEMPSINPRNAIDPFAIVMKESKEEGST
jgi:hypothetical protein